MVIWEEKDLESKPIFEERYGSFKNYVSKELIFPEEAKVKQINGFVDIFFIIEPKTLTKWLS